MLADPISSGVVMALPWLLIVVMGITVEEVFCNQEMEIGDPPPRPEKGKYSHIRTI